MRKLFLDDIREPGRSWDVVRSYEAFTKYVEALGCPDVISFDHDLAFEHYPVAEGNPESEIPYDQYKAKTGYCALKWLLDKGLCPKVVIIHSFNPTGVANMINLLNERQPKGTTLYRISFGPKWYELDFYMEACNWAPEEKP